MAYPINSSPTPAGSANQSPAYSGIFIPTLWSPRILQKFYDSCVLAAISNTDYEGEIKDYGDKVTIRQRPTLTIRSYEVNQALLVERPSKAVITLDIDKGKYFNVMLDDVMRIQSDVNLLDMWSEDASEQLKIAIDTEVLAAIPAAIAAANQGASAGRISGFQSLGASTAPIKVSPYGTLSTGIFRPEHILTNLSTVLNEQNVPLTGRWCVVPGWVAGALRQSDILRRANEMGDGTSVIRNGLIGEVAGMSIYESNLLPSAAESGVPGLKAWWIIAGHKNGLTFASQLSELETMRAESTFSQVMRGLQVYGYKVVDPTCIAGAYVASV